MRRARAGRAAPGAAPGGAAAVPRAIAIALALCLLASCGARGAAEKARRERVEAARAEVAGLEERLKAAADDGGRIECLRSILEIEVMRSGELERALKRFAEYAPLLSSDPMSRVYSAVAQSMMAGKARKVEDKLSWLMKGMRSFEELREEYPDDEEVLLYQASTYANFPVEVGAKSEVLDLLALMRGRYAAGDWKLDEGAAGQVLYVYSTLGSAYGDAASAAEIEASRSDFARASPAFAAALASALEAERAAAPGGSPGEGAR